MTRTVRWTSADLDALPDDGTRYEIIAGSLYMSKQPEWHHQLTCTNIAGILNNWSIPRNLGVANAAPGVIFADDDDVAPDVVWASGERLAEILGADGKLHGPPELVIEVLSPGAANTRRDREVKLSLYTRQGVDEYWIVDWRQRSIEIYRRVNGLLERVRGASGEDIIDTPLLPGLPIPLASIFTGT